MCDPVTIGLLAAGTLASVGGTVYAANEANDNNARVAEARNKVLRDTQARNKIISDRSREEFNKRITQIAPETSQPALANDQAQRAETIQSNVDSAPESVDIPDSVAAPKVVQTALGERLAKAAAKASDRSEALGKLGGFGDFFQNENLANNAAGREIDTQSNFLRGNMGILPSQQDYAEIGAYRPSSGLGQILSTLGGVAGMAAGSGALSPGASAGSFYLPNMKLKGRPGTLGGSV